MFQEIKKNLPICYGKVSSRSQQDSLFFGFKKLKNIKFKKLYL